MNYRWGFLHDLDTAIKAIQANRQSTPKPQPLRRERKKRGLE